MHLKVRRLDIFGDSNLIISQARGEWRVKEERLKPYHDHLENLGKQFEKVAFFYLPREENPLADSLATLASMIQIPTGVRMMPLVIDQRYEPPFCMIAAIEDEEDEVPWYKDVWNFIEK